MDDSIDSQSEEEASLRAAVSKLKEASEASVASVDPLNLLRKNRDLQSELARVVERACNARVKNEDMRHLCYTVIHTRQQRNKNDKTARPIKASSMSHCSVFFDNRRRLLVRTCEDDVELTASRCSAGSLWGRDGKRPRLSDESEGQYRLLMQLPPSFQRSFAWSPAETRSLCCAVLSVVQEKLGNGVFQQSTELTLEELKQGIEECRNVRLDSVLASTMVCSFGNEDWQKVARRIDARRSCRECQIQWNAFVRPDRNQTPIGLEEAEILKTIAAEHDLSNVKQGRIT